MSRHDLTDEQRPVLKPHILERQTKRGRPRNDDRQTLNGILYVLKTAVPAKTYPPSMGQP